MRSLLLIAAVLLAAMSLATAQQAQERRYADVGAWSVTEVVIGGRFSRCVAETGGEPGPLRFSQGAGGGWGLSLPSSPSFSPREQVLVDVRAGGDRRSVTFTVDAQGDRMVADADEDGLRGIFEKARNNRVAFELQTALRPTISFTVTDWDGALRAVAECRRQAVAAQPVAPAAPAPQASGAGGGGDADLPPAAPVGRYVFTDRRMGEWTIEYLARDPAGRQVVACRATRGYEADGSLRYTLVALPGTQTAADVLIDFAASGPDNRTPRDRQPVTVTFGTERAGTRFVSRTTTDPDGFVRARILVRLIEGPNPFDDKFTTSRDMTIRWAGDGEAVFALGGSRAATQAASTCFFNRVK
jgi:hypothetical protein